MLPLLIQIDAIFDLTPVVNQLLEEYLLLLARLQNLPFLLLISVHFPQVLCLFPEALQLGAHLLELYVLEFDFLLHSLYDFLQFLNAFILLVLFLFAISI